MTRTGHHLCVAALVIAATVLTGCAHNRQGGLFGAAPARQENSLYQGSYVDQQVERQINRQTSHIDQRITREMDRTADRLVEDALDSVFN